MYLGALLFFEAEKKKGWKMCFGLFEKRRTMRKDVTGLKLIRELLCRARCLLWTYAVMIWQTEK